MRYWLDLFTPETWARFRQHGSNVSGFPRVMRNQAREIEVGDLFICYMVRLSRFCGVLKVESEIFEDSTPIFADVDDPFPVRCRVAAECMLEPEHSIPVLDDSIWNHLSLTRDRNKGRGWGMVFRRSLRTFTPDDGRFLESRIRAQCANPIAHPLSDSDLRHLRARPRVATLSGAVAVEVPESHEDSEEQGESTDVVARDSIRVQALLAEIGSKMGFHIWIPRADRARVNELLSNDLRSFLIERLPLNYDEATLRTIEQIDVLWLRGRAITRAFEVEHTTAIYSGLLRMADLLALQPNMNIPLYIVAPEAKREKVLREIQRPVFALLDRGPLSETCSYLPYSAVEEIASNPSLQHLKDSVLEEFEEYPESD